MINYDFAEKENVNFIESISLFYFGFFYHI
jgi:hypothetical protein